MAIQDPVRGGSASLTFEQPTVAPAPPAAPEWGSDVMAEMLRRLGVEYVALNPGASYRGLHDSLVNYLANDRPSMILCNHEEVAVGIAHGYAKYSGRAMGAILHSNVGLMHGSMAIFNAWADRMPILVMGGNGPMDATQRRPWIDWLHTTPGQGELVRNFTKWEHQPTSVGAVPEALIRAWRAALMEPRGPVYVDLDSGLQEERLDPARPIALPDPSEFPLPPTVAAAPEAVAEAARWLAQATFPVILLGRTAATDEAWRDLVALAEVLGAAVLLDGKSAASFPTNHALVQAGVGTRGGAEFNDVLRKADVVLALDRIDPAGTLRLALQPAGRGERAGRAEIAWPRLINVSMEAFALRSWAAEYQELPPASLDLTANTARTVTALLEAVRREVTDSSSLARLAEERTRVHRARRARLEQNWEAYRQQVWEQQPVSIARMVAELRAALGDRYPDTVLAQIPLAWPNGIWDFTRPGAYLGADGGAGIGSGPALSVGAGLAAQGSGRPVIGLVGDGALLMTPTTLWTAAHHNIPVMLVVANNRSYYNDEEHQERVARTRGRPPENRWVGQRIDQPAVDFAGLARDLGVEGFGQVADPADLADAFKGALAALDEGRPALVDVRITPR